MSDVVSNESSDIYKAGGVLVKDRKTLVNSARGMEYYITPGGKIEAGETPKQALARELMEEFQIEVDEAGMEPFGTFSAEAANQPGQIVHIEHFLVKKWRGEIRPDNEVEDVRWITSELPKDIKIGSIFVTKIIPKLKRLNLID